MSQLWALVIADFRDRSRSYGFLVTLALTLYFGYLFIPPTGARFHYTLTLGQYRGIYNSAWVGTVMAISGISIMSLFGFFVIKNTVSRDSRNGVGELLAATPLSKSKYIISKFISNSLYLFSLLGPLMVMALFMLLFRGESNGVDFIALYSPFIYMAVPTLLVTSALAVFFEVTPGLRRGIGNVLYFYLWMMPVVLFVELKTNLDAYALEIVQSDMKAAISKAVPEYEGGFTLGHPDLSIPAGSFVWQGIDWTPELLLTRLFWIGIALFLVLVSIPIFNRFDPARQSKAMLKVKKQGAGTLTLKVRSAMRFIMQPIFAALSTFQFGRLLVAEIQVTLLGMPVAWYLIAVGLWIATLVVPMHIAREILMPMCWIWPILIWSGSGVRERLHRVDQILFSTPHPVARHFMSVWVGGVALAVLTGSALMFRLFSGGQFDVLGAMLVGALFIPSLALFCGALTKSSRFFEITYLIIWYVGPINKLYQLDYMGATSKSIQAGMPLVYLGLAGAALALAIVTRSKQIRN